MSKLLAFITILSTATGRVEQVLNSIRRNVLAPIGRALDSVLAPLDRLLQPLANVFNRTLGDYYGEVTGLQFGFLTITLLLLLTGGIWAKELVLLGTSGGSLALEVVDLRRALALACIWAIFAMGWDVQSGYTGYISFGHSVLSGTAGYTVALLLVRTGGSTNILGMSIEWTYLTMTPVAVLMTLIIGLLLALPSLRLEGPYFSLITFIAVLLFFRLARAYSGTLGGIPGFQQPDYLVSPADPIMRYYMMLIPMLLIALVLTTITRSNVGLILTAVRENESAVSAAGINPTKFKLWSFVISSIPMAIGGVLLVGFGGNVDPNTFIVVDNSIEMIAMAVIGGMASILGPLGGAFLFEMMYHGVLGQFFEDGALRNLFLFVFVILILVLARDGLFRMLWHRLGSVRGDAE